MYMWLLVALVASVLVTGCSTIRHGKTQDLIVNTSPQGATATAGASSCETPCKLHLSRKSTEISIEKAGYDPIIVPLRKRLYFGAFVPGNLFNGTFGLGMLIDSANGSHKEIVPVDVTLTKGE